MLDIFEILGPIMVGPSSSHTAGAVRIGRMARTLLGEPPVKADIGLYGSFAETGRGHGTDRALVAGLLGMKPDDLRIPESFSVAKEQGLSFVFHPAELREAHPNTAVLTVEGASGKKTKKKDLGMMAMSYGYVYVAQISMGADKNQTLKAIAEAEAYDGPSLIIAYAPCINHGLKAGMGCSQLEAKLAVDCGYWATYRYNPALKEKGENPFVLDSKEPTADFREFLLGEVRYSSLLKQYPETAEALFAKTEQDAKERLNNYKRLAGKA